MANSTNDTDSGKAAWFWFETEAYKSSWPEWKHHEIEAHVKRQWHLVSAKVKQSLLPTLSKFHASFQRTDALRTEWNNHSFLRPDALDKYDEELLCYHSHNCIPADDRLIAARKLLDAAKATKETFLRVRQFHEDNQYLLTRDRRQCLQNIENGINREISFAQNELRQIEEDLPGCRQLEKKIRMVKREKGHPQGAGWVGSWFLGQGSFGRAELWVRQDSQGRIVDRLVVKDAMIDDAMNSRPGSWMLHEGMWTPSEIRCPQMLAGKEGSETILKVRGWRELLDQNYFRVLLAYCPFGELADIRIRNTDAGSAGSEDEKSLEPKLPQPFIWYAFECLAIAGVLMEQGELNPQGIRPWDQMYHSDIKLQNVFLDAPNDRKYAGYPSPILADWGFGQTCPAGTYVRGLGGTTCCESPENGGKYYLKNGTYINGAALNPKSDVWSVGMLIIGLMDRCKEGYDGLDFRKQPQPPRNPDITHLRGEYSDALLNLAVECTNYHPEDRPSFPNLLHRIRQHTGQAYGFTDEVNGLRSKPASDPAWRRPENYLANHIETFRMYRKLASIPDFEKPLNSLTQNIPPPPHPAKTLSDGMEYKGRVSADDTSLSRAGSERRKAAELGPKGRDQYLMWMGHRAKERERQMRRKAKLEEEKTKPKPTGGYRLEYSSDSSSANENDGSGDGPDLPTGKDGSASAGTGAAAAAADDADTLPQPQDLVQSRFHNAVRMRKSGSAAAGARPGARRARREYEVRARDGRSRSPRRSPRTDSEGSNRFLAPTRSRKREPRE